MISRLCKLGAQDEAQACALPHAHLQVLLVRLLKGVGRLIVWEISGASLCFKTVSWQTAIIRLRLVSETRRARQLQVTCFGSCEHVFMTTSCTPPSLYGRGIFQPSTHARVCAGRG